MPKDTLKEQLDRFGHLRLMELVLGVDLVPGRAIKSPLREDQHPSFNVFKTRTGGYAWKDFADTRGDVYGLVMELHHLDFKQAIEYLGDLAGILKSNRRMTLGPRTRVVRIKPAKPAATFDIIRREWMLEDTVYWSQYRIGLGALSAFDILPCSQVSIHTDKITEIRHSPKDPLYCMLIDGKVKVYRPLHSNKRFKYMGNTGSDRIFGLRQFKKGVMYKHVVITAGQKDAMTLMCMEPGVRAIAFNSENIVITETMMQRIVPWAENLWICYDNDNTGKDNQAKLVKQFPFLKPIHLDRFTERKDISDMVAAAENGAIQQFKELFT